MKTTGNILIFASSSGHCTLDCPYCVVQPIAKHEPSLTEMDLDFLLDTFRQKTFIGFSGKGDFFAGYQKSDRLLERILDKDVEVALDINGVLLHEFAELGEASLEKIQGVNLTMHYQQLKVKKVRRRWRDHALGIIARSKHDLFLGTVVSPLVKDLWIESLEFYEREVFLKTGWKIVLVPDVQHALNPDEQAELHRLENRFAHMIDHTHCEDFAHPFEAYSKVFCPAGKTYFRIWNTGEIDGCPNVAALKQMGNAKQRRLLPRAHLFPCKEARYCDCHAIVGMGRMYYADDASALIPFRKD